MPGSGDRPENRIEAVFRFGVGFIFSISFLVLTAVPWIYGREFEVRQSGGTCVVATNGSTSFTICENAPTAGSVVLLDRRNGSPVRRNLGRLIAAGAIPLLLGVWICLRN